MELDIPLVGNEEMERRAALMKPLVRDEGRLREIAPVDLYSVSFVWAPKFKKVVDRDELMIVTKAKTLHRFGFHGFFKPSVGEVLAQLPPFITERLGKRIQLFFEVEGPEDIHDLNLEPEALNAGFHVSKTTFYIRKKDFDQWLRM